MLTDRAADFFDLVLGDLQAEFWQIMELTTLFDPACFLLQIILAVFAVGRTMHDHYIR
jgi:hypothetical protein